MDSSGRQAEAGRERRAKVINAAGALQAAAKLVEAAEVLMRYPGAVQVRYAPTLRESACRRGASEER